MPRLPPGLLKSSLPGVYMLIAAVPASSTATFYSVCVTIASGIPPTYSESHPPKRACLLLFSQPDPRDLPISSWLFKVLIILPSLPGVGHTGAVALLVWLEAAALHSADGGSDHAS